MMQQQVETSGNRFSARYRFDPELQIWRPREEKQQIAYCDGPSEQRLWQQIQQVNELRYGSDALNDLIVDWPSYYHLSVDRPNVLRPLHSFLKSRVLEFGSGCGAISRYLGEVASDVVAVEGTLRRAAITKQRCRDMPHVQVYCDHIMDFQDNTLFSAVTLIGVLEYAQCFIAGTDAIERLLKKCQQHLTEDGVLIIAIENQLGLKYFAGAYEDHTGIAYDGLHQGYKPQGPVTFGRKILTSSLQQAGFEDIAFYGAFPDYKFAQLILSPEGLVASDVVIEDLLGHMSAPDQDKPYERRFAEEMVWPLLKKNKLLADLANSFLIVASPKKIKKPYAEQAPHLAYMYSLSRRSAFAKETILHKTKENALLLHRSRLYPQLPPKREEVSQTIVVEEEVISGTLYSRHLSRLLNQPGWSTQQVIAWAQPWIRLLQGYRLPKQEEQLEDFIPGAMVDCTPFNIMILADGTLQSFDLEWVIEKPVLEAWVVYRGLYFSLQRHRSIAKPIQGTSQLSIDLTMEIMKYYGYAADSAASKLYDDLEKKYFSLARRSSMHILQFRNNAKHPRDPAVDDGKLLVSQRLQQMTAKMMQRLVALDQCDNLLLSSLPLEKEAILRQALQPSEKVYADPLNLLKKTFDENFYLNEYKDVAMSQFHPLEHYILWGSWEHRRPNAWFAAEDYAEKYPFLVASRILPLVHFLSALLVR